jgi:hypothetical protein
MTLTDTTEERLEQLEREVGELRRMVEDFSRVGRAPGRFRHIPLNKPENIQRERAYNYRLEARGQITEETMNSRLRALDRIEAGLGRKELAEARRMREEYEARRRSPRMPLALENGEDEQDEVRR